MLRLAPTRSRILPLTPMSGCSCETTRVIHQISMYWRRHRQSSLVCVGPCLSTTAENGPLREARVLGRIRVIVATVAVFSVPVRLKNSAGVRHPRVMRGRAFNRCSIAVRSADHEPCDIAAGVLPSEELPTRSSTPPLCLARSNQSTSPVTSVRTSRSTHSESCGSSSSVFSPRARGTYG